MEAIIFISGILTMFFVLCVVAYKQNKKEKEKYADPKFEIGDKIRLRPDEPWEENNMVHEVLSTTKTAYQIDRTMFPTLKRKAAYLYEKVEGK